MKRIRRLIKNKEYAQSSRDKRKQYITELECKLSIVNGEKAALQQKVNSLELENKTLKFHLARILKTSSQKLGTINKTAMATLFVIVFSFGIFAMGGGSLNALTGNDLPHAGVSSMKNRDFNTGRIILWDESSVELESVPEPTIIHKYTPLFIQDFLVKYQLLVPSSPQIARPTARKLESIDTTILSVEQIEILKSKLCSQPETESLYPELCNLKPREKMDL